MATVPTFITFVAGSVLTAAQLNATVRDAGNFWLTVKPALEVRQGISQSVPAAVWTSITMDVEDYDNDGMHSTSSNTSRATCVTPGRYLFIAGCDFTANTTGSRGYKLIKNGSASYAKQGQALSNTGTDVAYTTAVVLLLAAADYIEVQAWQNSGGALSTSNGDGQPRLQAMWLANA